MLFQFPLAMIRYWHRWTTIRWRHIRGLYWRPSHRVSRFLCSSEFEVNFLAWGVLGTPIIVRGDSGFCREDL